MRAWRPPRPKAPAPENRSGLKAELTNAVNASAADRQAMGAEALELGGRISAAISVHACDVAAQRSRASRGLRRDHNWTLRLTGSGLGPGRFCFCGEAVEPGAPLNAIRGGTPITRTRRKAPTSRPAPPPPNETSPHPLTPPHPRHPP